MSSSDVRNYFLIVLVLLAGLHAKISAAAGHDGWALLWSVLGALYALAMLVSMYEKQVVAALLWSFLLVLRVRLRLAALGRRFSTAARRLFLRKPRQNP